MLHLKGMRSYDSLKKKSYLIRRLENIQKKIYLILLERNYFLTVNKLKIAKIIV